jgi:dTDP-glucose pyrophosphorylase
LQKSPRDEYELTDAIIAMVADNCVLAGLEIQGRWVDDARSGGFGRARKRIRQIKWRS